MIFSIPTFTVLWVKSMITTNFSPWSPWSEVIPMWYLCPALTSLCLLQTRAYLTEYYREHNVVLLRLLNRLGQPLPSWLRQDLQSPSWSWDRPTPQPGVWIRVWTGPSDRTIGCASFVACLLCRMCVPWSWHYSSAFPEENGQDWSPLSGVMLQTGLIWGEVTNKDLESLGWRWGDDRGKGGLRPRFHQAYSSVQHGLEQRRCIIYHIGRSKAGNVW